MPVLLMHFMAKKHTFHVADAKKHTKCGMFCVNSTKGRGNIMASWLAPLIAILSTAICLFLWFRDVRRIMMEQKSTVESAKAQLVTFREKAQKSRDDSNAAAVLARSESIYRQAVEHYNRTLRKSWIYLPAALMGFRTIREGGEQS